MINKDTYKRFTERDVFDNADIIGVDTQTLCGNLSYEELYRTTKALNYFAELEDRIENGTLLELPCKVGDKVWWVNQYSPRPRIEEYEVSTITTGKDNKIYLGLGFSFFTFMIDEVYYTKAQAEARLKELQEKEQ